MGRLKATPMALMLSIRVAFVAPWTLDLGMSRARAMPTAIIMPDTTRTMVLMALELSALSRLNRDTQTVVTIRPTTPRRASRLPNMPPCSLESASRLMHLMEEDQKVSTVVTAHSTWIIISMV